MTSVKDLGESLRRRQSVADGLLRGEESGGGSATGLALLVLGCAVLAFAGALASIATLAPAYLWLPESMTRLGIQSGSLLATGSVLAAAGLCLRAISAKEASLQSAIRHAGSSNVLVECQEELREGLNKVHFALRVLQESTKGLLEVAHEQSLKRESGNHEDAVFHLAASLDQLGVRLEDRLESQGSGLERRLGSLDDTLEETRRLLVQWLEQSARQREAQERAQAPTEHEPVHESHSSRARRSEGRRRTQEEEELEVLVTFEDELEHAPPVEHEPRKEKRPAPKPAQGPKPPLGVLDDLDDFGANVGPGVQADEPANPSFLLDPELTRKLDEMARPELDAPAAQEQHEALTNAKLSQLQELLSDASLRKALDGLRRGAPPKG